MQLHLLECHGAGAPISAAVSDLPRHVSSLLSNLEDLLIFVMIEGLLEMLCIFRPFFRLIWVLICPQVRYEVKLGHIMLIWAICGAV